MGNLPVTKSQFAELVTMPKSAVPRYRVRVKALPKAKRRLRRKPKKVKRARRTEFAVHDESEFVDAAKHLLSLNAKTKVRTKSLAKNLERDRASKPVNAKKNWRKLRVVAAMMPMNRQKFQNLEIAQLKGQIAWITSRMDQMVPAGRPSEPSKAKKSKCRVKKKAVEITSLLKKFEHPLTAFRKRQVAASHLHEPNVMPLTVERTSLHLARFSDQTRCRTSLTEFLGSL